MGLISRVSSRTYRSESKMQRLFSGARRALSVSASRQANIYAVPFGAGLNHDQRVDAWCDYFDHPECDEIYFNDGLWAAAHDNWVAPPEVWQSALYACRRNNRYDHAIRTLEVLKMTCLNNRAAYHWVMQELQPTIADLGMKTPEDLGIYDDAVELDDI